MDNKDGRVIVPWGKNAQRINEFIKSFEELSPKDIVINIDASDYVYCPKYTYQFKKSIVSEGFLDNRKARLAISKSSRIAILTIYN